MPIKPILIHGIVDPLREVGLQLGGGDGDAVQEQYEVDGVLVVCRVVDLPDDAGDWRRST
jgi:hypothetical protein